MDLKNKIQSRKKFISIGVSTAALFTAFRFLIPKKAEKKTETVKMLTQDGKLVEIDAKSFYPDRGKKITNDQLQKWVNKKQS